MFLILAAWIILGFWVAAWAAFEIITKGLDDTPPLAAILLVAYVLTWVVMLKNKQVNAWVTRKSRD